MKGDTDLTKCCQMHESDLEGTASFTNLQLQEDTYWVYKIQTKGLFKLNVFFFFFKRCSLKPHSRESLLP